MTVDQARFHQALLDPERPVPVGLTDPAGRTAARRFDVYRNNVVMGLVEALHSSFPVLRKLLGAPFFDEMARVFLRLHPPASPLLMFYGAEMPGFLTGFAPAAHLGYLPDIARLELALRHSYHAADADPAGSSVLTAVAPEQLAGLLLSLTPATRLVRSQWPIHSIWRYNATEGAPKPVMQSEDVLVLRPAFDPIPHLVPRGGGAFIAALAAGQTLQDAADAASATPGFDLGATLGLLLQGRAIRTITWEAE